MAQAVAPFLSLLPLALLPPLQRHLRHIKGILARNIVTSEPFTLTSCYYRFFVLQKADESDSLRDDEEILVYTSEVVKTTMNPTWRHLDGHTIPHHLQSAIRCKIQVCSTHPEKILFENVVDIRLLDYIGIELKNMGSFGPNSLIFELIDGFYMLNPIAIKYDTVKNSSNLRPIGMSYNVENLLLMLTIHKQLEYRAQQTENYIQEIHERLLFNKEYSLKLQRRDMARLRVRRLKEQYEEDLQAWEEEKARAQIKRKDLLPKIRTVSKAEISLLASKKILAEEKKNLDHTEQLCEKLCSGIVAKKWEFISQLRIIYPIDEPSKSNIFTIAGFKLPNSDFNGCDEEQIATALGFVCHVLFMVSKYLEIPLRYPMIPMCSRSVIRDDISQQTSPKFPLYSRGVDRTRFEYAVFLLNKNVEQLLHSVEVNCGPLRNTLPNLNQLLKGSKANNQISQ